MPDGMTSEATVPEAVERGDKLTQLYERNYTPDGDMRAAAVDLVCDVLHAAEARGDDPEALMQSAAHHWASEREGDDAEEVAMRHRPPNRQEEEARAKSYTSELRGTLLEQVKRCRRGEGSLEDYREAFRLADSAALATGELTRGAGS